MDFGALLASVLASATTAAIGILAARRFQKLGGGVAQDRLNNILEQTAQAAERNMAELKTEFAGCKKRLMEVEAELKAVRAERINLKQEINDLYEKISALRPDRRGAKDRTDD